MQDIRISYRENVDEAQRTVLWGVAPSDGGGVSLVQTSSGSHNCWPSPSCGFRCRAIANPRRPEGDLVQNPLMRSFLFLFEFEEHHLQTKISIRLKSASSLRRTRNLSVQRNSEEELRSSSGLKKRIVGWHLYILETHEARKKCCRMSMFFMIIRKMREGSFRWLIATPGLEI